jgi:hypothetical protein
MLGQRPARRLAPLECLHRDPLAPRRIGGDPCRGFGLSGIFFHVGKLKLELLEHDAAFRRLPILLVPQLRDRELHLLDQQLPSTDFGFGVTRLRLRLQARGLRGGKRLTLRDDQCMRAGEISRKRISGAHHR